MVNCAVNGERSGCLIDGGATGDFIDLSFAASLGLPLTPVDDPMTVTVADGSSMISASRVAVTLTFAGRFTATRQLHVVDLKGQFPIILGKPWLRDVNPDINWARNEVWVGKPGRKRILLQGRRMHTLLDDHCLLISAIQVKRLHSRGCATQLMVIRDAPASDPLAEACDPKCSPVADVVSKFADVFAPIAGPPPERLVKHTIELEPGSRPTVGPIYRMSEGELEELRKQIADLLAKGFIRPSASPFGAPVLFVRKKDGSYRLCVDYRALNKNTIRDAYPLPRIDDLLDRLHGAQFFTSLDMQMGYHQVEVAPDDVPKTAMRTRYGSYEFVVLPFGLCNAPATYQRLMNQILDPLIDRCVIVYLDDVLIFSKTLEEHKEHLAAVLELLQKAKMFCKISKCHFAQREVSFLGHIVGADGIRMDPAKVRAVQEWPTPTSLTDLRSFLGLANFYRRFVKDYSKIALPLTDLTKKLPGQLAWKAAHAEAFQQLKEALSSAPVLAPPDPKLPFHVGTDASDFALGAVLSQGGRPVAFESRKLSPAECNYPTHEKENLAIVHALKVWRHYLMDKKFTVSTDHDSLRHLQTMPHPSRRQMRWLELLAEYDFNIEYIKGPTNVVADALSRRADLRLAVMAAGHEAARFASGLLTKFKAAVSKDAEYKEWLSAPKRGFSAGTDGLLYKQVGKGSNGADQLRLVVPAALQQTLLQEAHDVPISGHLGVDKTLARLQQLYWWPAMRAAVRAHVKQCVSCQRNKPSNQAPGGLLQPLPIPEEAWSSVSLDLITKLPTTAAGYDAVVVFVDRLTKMIHIVPTVTACDGPMVARLFFDNVFKHHGMPHELVSDRDPRFTGSFWKELFTLSGTKLSMSTHNHPQTDGQTERANRVIEEMLRHYVGIRLTDWDAHLTAVEFAYNSSVQASTGYSPFYLNTGRHPTVPMTVRFKRGSGDARRLSEPVQFASELAQHIETAKRNLQSAQDRQKAYADRSRRDESFVLGDQVLVSARVFEDRTAQSFAKKLQPRFYGPYPITEVISSVAYRLQLPTHMRAHDVFHVSMLRRFVPGGAAADAQPPIAVVRGEPLWEVEKVTQRRWSGGGWQYRIRWAGYSAAHDTWEPWENVKMLDAVKDYDAKHPKKKKQ